MIQPNNQQHLLAQRPTYSDAELTQYISHLRRHLPSSQALPSSIGDLPSLRASAASSPLSTLGSLMKLHLSAIPWGSLGLHYSSTHKLPITPPSHLLEKLTVRNHGGYCMEQNLFFSNVLRSLGYEVYLSGARISAAVMDRGDMSNEERDGFGGWEHMVIFVTLDHDANPTAAAASEGSGRAKYLVDVGFGAGNAIAPVLLKEGEECDCQPGMRGRVAKRELGASTQPQKQVMWMFQSKTQGKEDIGEDGWTNAYCFAELEWFERDFEVSNYKTSTSPESWFTFTFLFTRMLLRGERAADLTSTSEGSEGVDSDGAVEVVGSVTIVGDTLTRRIGGGKSEVLKQFTTEDERVEALKEWFDVELSKEEREGIRGMVTELKE